MTNLNIDFESRCRIAVSLFDFTGKMLEPWRDAGYECWIIDVQHPVAVGSGGVTREDGFVKVHADLSRPWLPPFDRHDIAFVSAFPPCDHLSVSGARWFQGKGLRALSWSINLFATAAEFCEWSGAPYVIENPVSTISSYWRKPDHSFSPHEYTRFNRDDNYTKKTCLWTGNGFVMPDKYRDNSLPPPDDRIHKCAPGEHRKNFRSATPSGFAKAVFETTTRDITKQTGESK